MILGFVCFIVAAMFVVNIAFACGKCEQRENGWFNLIFGLMLLFVILAGMVKEWVGPTSAVYPTPALWWAAQVTLFAMTYVFLGLQRIKDFDGRVVGWWCLFVVINIPLPAYQTYLTGDIPLVLIWIWWGWLWALFWYSMALRRGSGKLFGRVTVASMVIGFIFTLWIPSLYMLNGWW
ncbi:MAG: AmiS/UreI family transporter [Synergistaceae bacterium]|nr:AmiS/UreI family transporter [Synergistaceae bacterium]